jgi:hypothetical protein
LPTLTAAPFAAQPVPFDPRYFNLTFGFERSGELGFWQALHLSDETLFVESA